MTLPFTPDQFFEVFARYNAAIWPAQIVASTLGVLAFAGLALGNRVGDRLILAILALFWAWNGIAYHALHFATINPAGYGFAALFVLQAALFLRAALSAAPPRFRFSAALPALLAFVTSLFAITLYGAIGRALGHGGMAGPLFGVAPCPTTLFTLGLLSFAAPSGVLWIAAIPMIWALIGASAALLLGVFEDLSLLAAVAVFAHAAVRARRGAPEAAASARGDESPP